MTVTVSGSKTVHAARHAAGGADALTPAAIGAATTGALAYEVSTARTAEAMAVPRWAPTTAYTLGQQIVSPNNDIVTANVAHTSAAAYATDVAKWTLTSSFLTPTVASNTYGLIGPYDARRSGVVANGTTNDRAAVVAAITAVQAAGGFTVLLPPGRIRNTGGEISLPDGVQIMGQGRGVTIWDGPGFEFTTNNAVTGITFTGTNVATGSAAIRMRTATAATDGNVNRCAFTTFPNGVAVYLNNCTGGGPARIVVDGNQFQDCAVAVLMETVFNCRVSNNSSVNAAATGRHFIFYAAQGCQFIGNTTEGGVTGILGLARHNVAGTVNIQGNTIMGNRIVSPSEEGISLDSLGNDAAGVCVVDWGTVAAKGFNSGVPGGQLAITLDSAFSTLPSNYFYFQTMVITTGACAGTVLDITGSSGAVQLANGCRVSVWTGISVGDEVVIGLPMVGNTISGNTIEDAGTYSIDLWGFCIGNIITGNTCISTLTGTNANTGGPQGGVEVWGLDGLVAATSRFTTRLGRAPAVNNIVANNTLQRCDLRFSVEAYSGSPGYSLVGNVRTGNVLTNCDSTS